jgi:hypothetical protein
MPDSHYKSVRGSLKVIDSRAVKSCGGCTACCTIMSVDALNKETYTPCQHICQQGCAIYTDKPMECGVWECAWKSGWIDGDERRRPDQLGVMFEFRLVGGSSFLWVYEVWPDAFDYHKVQYLLGRLGNKELLVKCKYGSMRVEAKPEIIEYLKRNGVGIQDVPIVPLQILADAEGKVVGTLITERVGNEFIMRRLDGPEQL